MNDSMKKYESSFLVYCCSIFVVSFIVLFATPAISAAAVTVRITEISYNPEGNDSKREWIEIIVLGGSINITELAFREDETNHKLKVVNGKTIAENGDIFVIADNTESFLSDNSSFTGNLIDSTFSLSNTGETLEIIKKENDERLHSITYTDEHGLIEGSTTLHISQDNTIVAKPPTPGAVSGFSIPTDEMPTSQPSIETSTVKTKRNTYIKTIDDFQITITPYPILTNMLVELLLEEKSRHSDYIYGVNGVWNFGDGTVVDDSVAYHVYKNKGDYVISVQPKNFSKPIKISTKVVDLSLKFQVVNNELVHITNNNSFELDISKWKIVNGTYEFVFPENSFIASKATLPINFSVQSNEVVQLLNNRKDIIASSRLQTDEAVKQIVPPSPQPVTPQSTTKKEVAEVEVPTPNVVPEKTMLSIPPSTITPMIETRSKKKPMLSMAFVWLGIFIGLLFIVITPLLFAKTKENKKHFSTTTRKNKK